LRHLLEFDHPGRHQAGDADAQEFIQCFAVIFPKVGDGMMIDLDSAAQPPVGVVGVGQANDFPRTEARRIFAATRVLIYPPTDCSGKHDMMARQVRP
jgi:hypothetical protein